MRHNAVNNLIKRSLASADVLPMLQPNSLSRDDGKRPDGVTVLPWANDRCMVWDFARLDTLTSSQLKRLQVLSPSAVANDAESRKSLKYVVVCGVNIVYHGSVRYSEKPPFGSVFVLYHGHECLRNCGFGSVIMSFDGFVLFFSS